MKFLSLFFIFISINLYAQSDDCQELVTFSPDTSDGRNSFRMQSFMTTSFGNMENTTNVDAAKNMKMSIKSSMAMSRESEMIVMNGIMYTKAKEDTVWWYKNMSKQEVKQPPIPQFEQCKKVGSEVLDGVDFEIFEVKVKAKEMQAQGFDSLQAARIWADRARKKIKKMEIATKNDKMDIKVVIEYAVAVTIEKPKNALPDSLRPKPAVRERRKLTTPLFEDYRNDPVVPENDRSKDFAEYKDGPKALFDFISTNLVYPQAAKDAKKEGTVYLGFMVEPDGTISDIKVKRGLGYGCDEAAIEVIKKTSGNWRPVLSGGVAIQSPYTVPIKFKL